MKVSVLGAGAWGTAMAVRTAARHEVRLWARDPLQVEQMRQTGTNARYLPGIGLPDSIAPVASLDEAVDQARDGLLILATPTDAVRPVLRELKALGAGSFIWLSKGFERGSARLTHEVVTDELGAAEAGPLSGPSFSHEIARGLPAALTVAGPARLCERVTEALHGIGLRIYSAQDVTGVEVGGAVKNVMAIATGISDALALGSNARAALMTRGLAEMSRLGVALGAQSATFMGLAGVGDLILTCTGDLSRNRQIGLLLGRGVPLNDALQQLGHVAEGVWSAPAVAARARELNVSMPITEAVCAVLEGKSTPQDALRGLLARDPRREDLP